MADRYLLESGAPDGYLLEDGSGVLLLEGPLPSDDTENGWWAGINLCSVGIAIAGAALALATSVSIANTFKEPAELPPPPMGGGVLKDEAKVVRWYQGDDFVAAATPLTDDEGGWTIYVPPKETAKLLYLPDPEQIPAGSLFGVPTEGDFIPSPVQPKLHLWVGQWQDEIITQSFTPEEAYWAQFFFPQKLPKSFIWQGEDELITPLTNPVLDEDYWFTPLNSLSSSPVVRLWFSAGEWVAPAAGNFTPSEEDWQLLPTKTSDITSTIWAVEEDIVPQPVVAVVGGGVIKDRANVLKWYQGDELPPPPTPLPIAEEYWLNLIPQPPVFSSWVGVDEDLIVPQPLPFSAEEYWAFPVPLWEKAVVQGPNWDNADLFWTLEETEYQPPVHPLSILTTVWASEEEIVPQLPVSTFADEDFWTIPRQWGVAPFITTFTADDEIGDFVPPPVVQVIETDGVRKKKSKHPKEEISELVDEVVQERIAPPPEPRPELEALEENEKYRIVPVYKPSIDAIPLSAPAAPPEEDDDEIVAYLISIGML